VCVSHSRHCPRDFDFHVFENHSPRDRSNFVACVFYTYCKTLVIKLKYFPVFFFVVFLVLPLRHQRSRSDLGDVLAVATVMGSWNFE